MKFKSGTYVCADCLKCAVYQKALTMPDNAPTYLVYADLYKVLFGEEDG